MTYCVACESIYEDNETKCCKCGGSLSNIPPYFFGGNDNAVVTIPKKSKRFLRPSDIKAIEIKKSFISGYEMFGKLPFHFSMLLYGKKGSGKSTVALRIANVISKTKWRGNVAFVSLEEGKDSATIQTKIQNNVDSDNIVVIDNINDIDDAIKLEKCRNVFIDSISIVKLDLKRVKEIIDKVPGMSLFVAHATKADEEYDSKDYKGESGMGHEVDIVAKATKDHRLIIDGKNRFGPSDKEMEIIFDYDEDQQEPIATEGDEDVQEEKEEDKETIQNELFNSRPQREST